MRSSSAGRDRRDAALRVVGAVERAAPGRHPRRRARYRLDGDVAVRDDARLAAAPPQIVPARLPHDAREVVARAGADLVRFGKFDRDGSVRARAYQLGDEPVSYKIHTRRADDRHGVGRELQARREVAVLAPQIAPRLLASGHTRRRGIDWMAEELVRGSHPKGQAGVTAVVDALFATVARLYTASGFAPVPASRLLGAETVARFDEVVALQPGLAPFRDEVHRLLARDLHLDVALVHGDLVASNVLVRDDGSVILVDWEFARRLPVSDDATAVLTQAHDKDVAIAAIERHLGPHVGVDRESHRLRDQLVLSQVRMLSWYARRKRRAEEAGRGFAIQRDTDRRIASLAALLR